MADKARVAVELTLRGASDFRRQLGGVVGGFKTVSNAVSRAGANLFHFISIGKDLFRMTQNLARGAAQVTGALLDPNIKYEQALTAFEQMLGSADAAKERVEVLYELANRTPFLNPDVLEGGKALQGYGGAALATGENLQLTADAAAYAQAKFNEVSIWIGRMYGAIQAGRPFGEATERLTQLMILTGGERAELEGLAKSADMVDESMVKMVPYAEFIKLAKDEQSGNVAVWERFVQIMKKADGAAAKQAETMAGALSTIQGLWGEIKRLAGQRLFETMKQDVIGIRDDLGEAFQTQQIQEFADEAGKTIAKLFGDIKDATIGGITVEDLFAAAERDQLGTILTALVKTAGANFGIALYNAAIKYGPHVMRALLPGRLERWFGMDEDLALDRLASGRGGMEDIEALGYGTRHKLARQAVESTSGAMFAGTTATLGGPGNLIADLLKHQDPAQVWGAIQRSAQAELGGAGPAARPYIDPGEALKKAGVDLYATRLAATMERTGMAALNLEKAIEGSTRAATY
jgi:hypothetical protein